MKRPLVLLLLIALGLGAFGLYRARQTLAWMTTAPALAEAQSAPFHVMAPDLPARWSFSRLSGGEPGNAEMKVGEFGFDPLDVSLLIMPLGQSVPADEVERRLAELQPGLPSGTRLETRDDGSAWLRHDKELEEAGWLHVRVLLSGSAVARVDVRVHPDAPGAWQQAALEIADSLSARGDTSPEALAAALAARAKGVCGGGELAACLYAGAGLRDLEELDAAAELLAAATSRAPPIAGLWANTAAAVKEIGADELTSGGSIELLAAQSDARQLEQVVSLNRLLGEVQRLRGDAEAAWRAYAACWRYDATLGCAQGLGAQARGALAAEVLTTEELLTLAQHVDERFGEDPAALLVSARIAEAASSFNHAKLYVTKLFERTEDPEVRREAVRIKIVPRPELKPLPCPRGTTAVAVGGGGMREEYCAKKARHQELPSGVRVGPARTFDPASSYPTSEMTWKDGSAGPPERFWWENGVLQRETWFGDDGTIRARSFDPLGVAIEQPRRDDEPTPELPPELPAKLPAMKDLILPPDGTASP